MSEVIEFILSEAEEYKRIAIAREERFGAVSAEALIQWGKYRALRKLARQIKEGEHKHSDTDAAQEA